VDIACKTNVKIDLMHVLESDVAYSIRENITNLHSFRAWVMLVVVN
jgi:hypothetical protein